MPLLVLAFLGLVLLDMGMMDLRRAEGLDGAGGNALLRDARREVDLYRSFALAATLAQQSQPFTGGAVQTRTWADIRALASTPAHLKGLEMPANWRVRGNSAAWVICAPVSEAAVPLLSTQLPQNSEALRSVVRMTVGSNDFVVLGEGDASNRTTYATWCGA